MGEDSKSEEAPRATGPTQNEPLPNVATTPAASPTLSEVDRRLNALTEVLRTAKFDFGDATQANVNELNTSAVAARLIGLLPAIRFRGELQWAMNAEIAAAQLLAKPPDLLLAKKIVDDLSWKAGIVRSWGTYSLWSGLAAFFILSVLLTFLGTTYVLPALNSAVGVPDRFKLDTMIGGLPIIVYLLVGLFGGLGSVASIATRSQELNSGPEPVRPAGLFIVGLTKPIIGIIFALFVGAVIQAEFLPLKPSDGVKPFFLIAIAFIAGFSERFASDVATRIQGSISDSRAPPPRPG
jgi:hypothetical protein